VSPVSSTAFDRLGIIGGTSEPSLSVADGWRFFFAYPDSRGQPAVHEGTGSLAHSLGRVKTHRLHFFRFALQSRFSSSRFSLLAICFCFCFCFCSSLNVEKRHHPCHHQTISEAISFLFVISIISWIYI
jgi:hypothetical protein